MIKIRKSNKCYNGCANEKRQYFIIQTNLLTTLISHHYYRKFQTIEQIPWKIFYCNQSQFNINNKYYHLKKRINILGVQFLCGRCTYQRQLIMHSPLYLRLSQLQHEQSCPQSDKNTQCKYKYITGQYYLPKKKTKHNVDYKYI